jgi:hypothetical protein
MKLDLVKSDYSSTEEYNEYIYGSGCCRSNVFKGFVAGKTQKYEQLRRSDAIRICFSKSKFSKRLEGTVLNRNYFPGVDLNSFDEEQEFNY